MQAYAVETHMEMSQEPFVPEQCTVRSSFCFLKVSTLVLDGVSALPMSCLPLSLIVPLASCFPVSQLVSPLVSACLPSSCHLLLDGLSAFPRPCLPLSPLPPCLPAIVSQLASQLVSACLPACPPLVSQLVFLLASLCWMVCPPSRGLVSQLVCLLVVGWRVPFVSQLFFLFSFVG